MIQKRTLLKVADNCGARIVGVFNIPGATRRRYARIGDVVIASVKSAEPRKSVKKKDIVKALIVRQRKSFGRKNGSYIKFDDNAAVILDKGKEPKATRIFGPIPREIKELGYDKIISMAQEVV